MEKNLKDTAVSAGDNCQPGIEIKTCSGDLNINTCEGKAYYNGNEIATKNDIPNSYEYVFIKNGINGTLLPNPFQYPDTLKVVSITPNDNVVAGSFTAETGGNTYDMDSLIGVIIAAGAPLTWDNEIKAGYNQSAVILKFEKL